MLERLIGSKLSPCLSNRGLENTYKILASGVDTLEISYNVLKYKLSDSQLEEIGNAKKKSQSTVFKNDKGYFRLNGNLFYVNRAGKERYEYVMYNSDLVINLHRDVRDSKYFPVLRFVLRSQLLWRLGWIRAIEYVDSIANIIAEVSGNMVSRVDLCADLGMALPSIHYSEISTRARKRSKFSKVEVVEFDSFGNGKKSTGYSFGRGKMMARIYDKLDEIYTSKKFWLKNIWSKNGWREGSPVTRFEVQFRRGVLKQLGVVDTDSLISLVAGLWDYFINKWLIIRYAESTRNKSRWSVRFWWKRLNDVDWGCLTKVTRLKVIKPKLERITKLWQGALVTSSAIITEFYRGSTTMSKLEILKQVKDFLDSPEWEYTTGKRMVKYGLLNI